MLLKKIFLSTLGLLLIGGALITGRLYSKVQSLKANKPQVAGITTEAPQYIPSNNYPSAPVGLTTNVDTNVQVPIPTVDPDPIITCIFQHIPNRTMRTSVCKSATECQLGNEWIFYSSMSACKAAQTQLIITPPPVQQTSTPYSGYISPLTTSPSYPPCTVYFPATKVTETYTTLTPSDCVSWQDAARITGQPIPTTDPNIAKNAQDQFNQINNNMQNLTPTNTQYITGTPIPCSSLQGQANIVGGGCQ